jgi:sulfide dehydrogenase cytochrome subunit
MKKLIPLVLSVLLPTSAFASESTWEVCDECHGTDGMGGSDPMVPVVAGIPTGHIEESIFAYVDGARLCVNAPRMCETVAVLSESEVAEVSEYYAQMVRGSSGEEFDIALAAEGAVLHQKYCARCHLPPEDEHVAYAIGIPLEGQRSKYLLFALETYFTGDRESLVEKMDEKMEMLNDGDLNKLVNFYSSYELFD